MFDMFAPLTIYTNIQCTGVAVVHALNWLSDAFSFNADSISGAEGAIITRRLVFLGL
jgi:hypothetical protein